MAITRANDGLKDTYDKLYRGNRDLWGPEHRQELVTLLQHIGEGHGRSALDIGSGNGQNLIFLAQHGFAVTGIDVSSEAIKNAKKNMEDKKVAGTFVVGDVMKTGIQGTFDVIMSSYTMHHLYDKDKEQFLEEIMGHVREGGHVLLAFFTAEFTDKGPGTGERYKTVEGRMKEFFETKGWKVLEYDEATGVNRMGNETQKGVIIAEKPGRLEEALHRNMRAQFAL